MNHVQKIKPRVEQVCQELGLQYATEENEGRMYVNLQGGPAVMPPSYSEQHGSHQQPHSAPQQGYQAPHQPQYQSGQQVQNNQQDEVTGLISMLLKCLCK